MMKKLTAKDPETKSADIVAENIARLKALFPEIMTEGKNGVSVNVDVLKSLVGDKTVADAEEKYGLNWHGKRQARQLALTPSTGTLRPCPEESVDWDTTQNLMIEGDNLEVLKLLQKSYAGKVKLIYIDPPYNTGKDFVYPDDFQDSIKNYLELTRQAENGGKISSNTEANGRFHTDWLNMMYPRLRVSRALLRDDGILFVTIDDAEVGNLRRICDDIFGEENFVANVVWHKKRGKDNSAEFFSRVHDHILCYARNRQVLALHYLPLDEETKKAYRNSDSDPRGDYRVLGLWSRGGQGGSSYAFTSKKGTHYSKREWLVGHDTMRAYDEDNRLVEVGDKLYRKLFITENKGAIPDTIWLDASNNANAADEMKTLFGDPPPFDTPKPLPLLTKMLALGTDTESLVLDFFAGSGTTGHAVLARNAAEGVNCRYILVQLPEPLDAEDKGQKTAAEFCMKLKKPLNIAELTKERLRRAAKKIKQDNPLFVKDLGFRVFKLATSNILEWDPERGKLSETLESSVEHLKTDRTESDILFELLLKLGLDLCVPMEEKTIAGKTVHSVGAGTLLVCLAPKIGRKDAEALALGIVEWHKALAPAGESTVVFRDSAFVDDVAKTNCAAILEQHGLTNVRSL